MKKQEDILYCSDEAFDEQKITQQYHALKTYGHESPRLANRLARMIYMLDNSPLGVFVTDLKGIIHFANQQAQNITGYTLDELKGNNMRILQSGHQDRNFYVAMWDHILEYGYWQGEVWNRKKDGSVYYQWMRLAAMRDHAGEVVEYMAIVADLSDQRYFKGQRMHQAFMDILTGLGSKSQLQNDMNSVIKDFPESKHFLILLNIHKFSDVNIRYGFKVGDLVLKEVAIRLRKNIGSHGLTYRFAGATFAVLIPNIASMERFAEIARNIDSGFDTPFFIDSHEITLNTNVGVSIYPNDGDNYDDILKNVEIALRYAKLPDTYRIQYSSESLNNEILKWIEMGEDLRQALQDQNFHMVYQVLVDNRSKTVKGAEALIRWIHPEKGLIPPNAFIPFAESEGLIVPLGYWIIERVFQDAQAFYKKYKSLFYFSVNISAKQIEDTQFVSRVTELVERYDIKPGQIVFEITERIASQKHEHVTKVFKALKALGFKIALDDFGKGESSLSFLINFDVDILKVDAAFITHIGENESKRRMTRAIFNFCDEISIETVAEGVETLEDVIYLSGQKCNTLQGYFFSKPVPYSEFELLASKMVYPWSRLF